MLTSQHSIGGASAPSQYTHGEKHMEPVKGAITQSVKNSAKFEALIGLGTSTLIFNSVIQNVLSGAEIPTSHIAMIVFMVISFFVNRGINILNHLAEMEARNRAAQIQADIQLKRLELEITKLKIQGVDGSAPPAAPVPPAV